MPPWRRGEQSAQSECLQHGGNLGATPYAPSGQGRTAAWADRRQRWQAGKSSLTSEARPQKHRQREQRWAKASLVLPPPRHTANVRRQHGDPLLGDVQSPNLERPLRSLHMPASTAPVGRWVLERWPLLLVAAAAQVRAAGRQLTSCTPAPPQQAPQAALALPMPQALTGGGTPRARRRSLAKAAAPGKAVDGVGGGSGGGNGKAADTQRRLTQAQLTVRSISTRAAGTCRALEAGVGSVAGRCRSPLTPLCRSLLYNVPQML